MSFGIPVRNGLGVGLLASTFLSTLRIGGRPTMSLDFIGTNSLDSRVTFTRATTATFVGSNGLIQTAAIDAPRFDYDPVTLAPKGLLIEEARTNTAVYSNDVTGLGWSIDGLTTSTPTTSPDGTPNAVLLLEDSSTGFHRAFQVPTTTAAAWTVTAFFKPSGRSWVWLRMNDSVGVKYAWFNVTTGVVGTVEAGLTATITPYKNGFYRCSITAATAAAGAAAVIFGTADADNSNSFTGDPAKGVYFYGFQIELGAFATSYIPTTTLAMTCNADDAAMTGTNFSSWYNQTEGSFVVSATATAASAIVLTASAGVITNQLWVQGGASGETTLQVYTAAAFVAQIGILPATAAKKIAAAYKTNDFAAAINGGAVATDTSGSIGIFDRLNIGANYNATGSYLNGHIGQIAYYSTRLSNTTLQALTT